MFNGKLEKNINGKLNTAIYILYSNYDRTCLISSKIIIYKQVFIYILMHTLIV